MKRVGDIAATAEDFAGLPYGTVLWDDAETDPRYSLHQINGLGYTEEQPWVIWSMRDRWHYFQESQPLRVIFIPEGVKT